MREDVLAGLDGGDPLGFLAALGLLRVASLVDTGARLRWVLQGSWVAALQLPGGRDPVDLVMDDVAVWRDGHPAVNFAVEADRQAEELAPLAKALKTAKEAAKKVLKARPDSEEVKSLVETCERECNEKAEAIRRCAKILDLKHPPAEFRALMRSVALVPAAAPFVAALATGVAADGSGQTKPTSLHFAAGQQRFMDAVLDLRDRVTREDVIEALHGPWVGRTEPKDMRWRAASERNRALLSFDPSKEKAAMIAGASWLAFQAMPLLPAVPVGARVATTGFSGSGKREQFTWPIWSDALSADAARVLIGTRGLADAPAAWREARGVRQVFESKVIRSSQGYGNFAAADPR